MGEGARLSRHFASCEGPRVRAPFGFSGSAFSGRHSNLEGSLWRSLVSVHSCGLLAGVPGLPLRPPARWRVLLLLLARLLSSMVTTLASMEQLAPAALGSLMQSHLVLRQHADALAGSSELARAYRAWAALAKLRRQVEWLGLHLQEWRMQQLQQESWLSELSVPIGLSVLNLIISLKNALLRLY